MSNLDDYEKYIKISLEETYYFTCMKTCITDFSTPLSRNEKACLAKCLDRSYDYMRIIQKQANPLLGPFQTKFLKVDGANLLSVKTASAQIF